MTNDSGTFKGVRSIIDKPAGQRKLLALDGGGMRGLVSIEVLTKIETILRARSGRGDAFRLCHYFDYIAGTSTGAIIGALLSLGKSCAEIKSLYTGFGAIMFDKGFIRERLEAEDKKFGPKVGKQLERARLAGHWVANRLDLTDRPYSKYEDAPVKAELKKQVGENSTLGTDTLQTLLLMVLCDPQTDRPWAVSNNPRRKFNDPAHPLTNVGIPLWQLVRASTAAPTVYPPQEIIIGGQPQLFVDGGITAWNNPAFQLFLQATLEPYGLGWPTGRDKMLLVSVGTGLKKRRQPTTSDRYNVETIMDMTLHNLISAANMQQDLSCRSLGHCIAGDAIDGELGTLIGSRGAGDPLFTYARYNTYLTREALDELGLPGVDVEDVEMLDSVAHAAELTKIGEQVAARKVDASHFAAFPA